MLLLALGSKSRLPPGSSWAAKGGGPEELRRPRRSSGHGAHQGEAGPGERLGTPAPPPPYACMAGHWPAIGDGTEGGSGLEAPPQPRNGSPLLLRLPPPAWTGRFLCCTSPAP